MMKEEFESLIGRNVTEKEYSIIEFVYTWHPAISETEGKNQMATLYTYYGMSVIIGMKKAAEYAKNIDTEISKLQNQIEDLKTRKESVKNGDFRLEQCLVELKDLDERFGRQNIPFQHICEKYGNITTRRARKIIGF